MDTLNNLTPLAQQTLFLAGNEAARLNHASVGTEHLLLGLISLGQGTAVNVLKKFGLDLQSIRRQIEELVRPGLSPSGNGELPFSPGAKKVLSIAAKEAKTLNHAHIGPEHLLMGLLYGADGLAARILKDTAIHVDWTRQAILRELDSSGSSGVSRQSKLTAEAQQILALAYKEAVRLNQTEVGTEHLLLGLIKAGAGPGVKSSASLVWTWKRYDLRWRS